MVVETHVTQHHDGAEQQGGGVRHVQAGNVGGGAVDLWDRHTRTGSDSEAQTFSESLQI